MSSVANNEPGNQQFFEFRKSQNDNYTGQSADFIYHDRLEPGSNVPIKKNQNSHDEISDLDAFHIYLKKTDSSDRNSGQEKPVATGATIEISPSNIDAQHLQNYMRLFKLLSRYYSNPLASSICSRTMLLPHQVQAATRVVESMKPRFLIADEVGLGKTIEAGLILKELMLKYSYQKVLICVPAPLLHQWKAELKTKFNEDFEIMTGARYRKQPQFISEHDRILVSVDLAKDPRYRSEFLEKNFDLVIFDEAHRLRRDQHKITRAWHFAEALSVRARAFILLSATPFRGKIEEIYYLIHLLDPDILGPLHSFINRFSEDSSGQLKETLAPVVIRRRKVDVGGFTKRFARTVKVTLSPEERAFYDATTNYVKREYNRAVAKGQHMKSFVMIVFQKLLDSSSYALLRALERRRERLQNQYYRAAGMARGALSLDHNKDEHSEILSDTFAGLSSEPGLPGFGEDLLENNSEFEPLWQELEDEPDSVEEYLSEFDEFDPRETLYEIEALNRLLSLGARIDIDSKMIMLNATIQKMQKAGHEKFLIFTQFKSTLQYIADYLAIDYRVEVFHGSLSAADKEKAIANFYAKEKNEKRASVLILTEAGGEGRNLQVASALFNYDLPWSPLKIEQRIGRIHRFGQKRDVHIVNFATSDTVAEKVLEILEKKIRIFEDALGESDTLLGVLEDEMNFAGNLWGFLQSKKSKKEWQSELSKSLDLARDNVGKIDRLLSPEFLDFDMNRFAEISDDKKQNTTREKELGSVVLQIASLAGLTVEKKSSDLYLFKTDHLSENHNFSKEILGTFSYELAASHDNYEYLAMGHPLVDFLIDSLLNRVETTAHYKVESADKKGTLFNLQAMIRIDRTYRRLFQVFVDEKGNVELLIGAESDLQTDFFAIKYTVTPMMSVDPFRFKKPLEVALGAIKPLVQQAAAKLQERIQPSADYWRENIKHSYRERDSELEEKLQIQKGKARWYDSGNMAPVIKRTVNKKRNEQLNMSKKLSSLSQSTRTKIDIEIKSIIQFE